MLRRIGQWLKETYSLTGWARIRKQSETEKPVVEEEEPEPGLTLKEKVSILQQNEIMIVFLSMLAELAWDVSERYRFDNNNGNGYAIRYLMEGYHVLISRRGLVYEETIQIGDGDDVEKRRTVLLSNIDYETECNNSKIHQSFLPKPEITFKLKTDDLVHLKGAWIALKAFQERKQAEKDAEGKEKALLKAEYKADIEKQIKDLGMDRIVKEERGRRDTN